MSLSQGRQVNLIYIMSPKFTSIGFIICTADSTKESTKEKDRKVTSCCFVEIVMNNE